MSDAFHSRRRFQHQVVALAALVASGLAPLTAHAQAFPNKPVRLIVTYPPGGSSDLMARIVAQKLSEHWGQQVLVESKPGAAGSIGMEFTARQPADNEANIAELLTWQGEPLQARQRAHIAVQLSTELEYKLGRTAATRALGVAALDLGLYEEAAASLTEAYQLAQEIETPEETLACLVALTQLHVERDAQSRARHFAARGLEVAEQRDPERYLPLLQAHLVRALAGTAPEQATQLVKAAERALADLPIPRRTQVALALAHARLALDHKDESRGHARSVMQIAGSRGFRLLSLESRALMAALTTGEEASTHRAVGQELMRDFTNGLSPEMARAFLRRPFLRHLGDPPTPLAEA